MERRERDAVIDECIRRVITGRTAVNFGHVPEVARALEWLRQDLQELKNAPYDQPSGDEIEALVSAARFVAKAERQPDSKGSLANLAEAIPVIEAALEPFDR